jgi:hypothetical protein
MNEDDEMTDDPSVAWMEPFDFAQDRLRGIREVRAGNPGFHPGYNKGVSLSKPT